MFGLFKKAEVDSRKAAAFAAWFCANEARIRQSVENRETDRQTLFQVLDEVEAELAKVYRDGYKGNIEFDYGGKDDEWELHLYHKNNKFLMTATTMIAEAVSTQDSRWKVVPAK